MIVPFSKVPRWVPSARTGTSPVGIAPPPGLRAVGQPPRQDLPVTAKAGLPDRAQTWPPDEHLPPAAVVPAAAVVPG